MKRRRWEPTKIGVANQLPQQRSSSRSSSRSTSREGRPGEQSQLFLSTAPKARQVLSRAEGVVEVQWPEADEAASDGQSVRTSRVGSGRSNRSRRSTTQQQRQRQQQQQQPALARTKRRLSHGADAEDAYSVASVDVVGDIGNLMVTRRSNQADGLLEMLSEVDEESEANKTGSEQSHRTPAPPPGASTRASKTAVRSHKGSVAARAGKQSYASVGTMTTINSAGNDDIDGDDDGDVGDDGRTQKAGDQGEADAVALAKDPLMRPFARPEIVHVQLASDAVARNVVGAVTLTVHDALEVGRVLLSVKITLRVILYTCLCVYVCMYMCVYVCVYVCPLTSVHVCAGFFFHSLLCFLCFCNPTSTLTNARSCTFLFYFFTAVCPLPLSARFCCADLGPHLHRVAAPCGQLSKRVD